MNRLSSVSTYFLILELLNEGKSGLLPNIEPIEMSEIFTELETRTENKMDRDKEAWATWFLGNDKHGTELERSNLLIFLETRRHMQRLWRSVSGPESE